MPEQVRCPDCDATLRVPDNLLGKNVKCPKCQTTFIAEIEEPAEGIVEKPSRSASRRPSLPPEESEEDLPPEEDEDEDRPRRRGRGRRASRGLAESMVAGPAIALMVVSGLAIALCLCGLIGNLLGAGLAAAAPGHKAGQSDSTQVAINAISGIGSAIFGLIYWTLVLFGAIKMKSLSSYGFSMTACILAMIPCSLCCILGLPFGIWGLVMLNKPEVKRAFS